MSSQTNKNYTRDAPVVGGGQSVREREEWEGGSGRSKSPTRAAKRLQHVLAYLEIHATGSSPRE